MVASKAQHDDYILGRSIAARLRLNQQHFLCPKIFGYLLHPKIPRTENMVVADVATGSGIWMLDAMSQLPASTTYHGLDIDLSQAPPKEWLPPNVSFSKYNLDEDLPVELEGAFDIINIRMIVLVVRGNDPSQVLQKAMRMLKPGGWLQWIDLDGTFSTLVDFVKTKPHNSGSAMKALHEKVIPSDPRFQPTWVPKLPDFFRANSFEQVEGDWKAPNDFLPWLAFVNDTFTPAYLELIGKMPPGAARDQLNLLYGQAAEESWNGTAWNSPRINVIGRKPKIVL